MFALAIMFFVLVYIAISVLVVQLARRWARRHGRSPAKAGWLAGLVMYLLVAWEQIPTYLLHKYYCATKVGYWVYKTPEQWKQENPGVAEHLHPASAGVPRLERAGFALNERFVWETRVSRPPLLPVVLIDDRVIDKHTGEAMVRSVKVSSGYGQFALGGKNSWRFWVGAAPCFPTGSRFGSVMERFRNIGEKSK